MATLNKGCVMATPLINLLDDELTKRLGDRHFFTIRDLKDFGFFGSTHSVRKALKVGKLAYIRISPRRCIIPRAAILEYLRNNITGGVEQLCKHKMNEYLEASNDSKA